MKVYLSSITGIDDAMVALMMSKRTWTFEKEDNIRKLVERVTFRNGIIRPDVSQEDFDMFQKKLDRLLEVCKGHITLGRYIDITATVEGLHRGGQDDWDAHAMRFNNRIVRSSTRLATFGVEKSDYYKDKILTTDEVAERLGIEMPTEVDFDGKHYVKVVNGYVEEKYKDDKDVLRGLYMLSIPSNFEFKINLTEFAHVYKMRNESTGANPEVKQLCEMLADAIESVHYQFNRKLLMEIQN